MEAGKIIYALLTADSGVSAITSGIYGNEARQGVDFPAVVYTVVSSVPQNSKSGFNAYISRVQCSCYATTYEGSVALCKAVVTALADKELGTYGGLLTHSIKLDSTQDFTDDAGIDGAYHVAADFFIHYING